MNSPAAVVLLFLLLGVAFAKVWYDGGSTIKTTQRTFIRCYPTDSPKKFQVMMQMTDIDNNLVVQSIFELASNEWRLSLKTDGTNSTRAPFKLPRTKPDNKEVVLLVLMEESGVWTTGGVSGLELVSKGRRNASDVRHIFVETFGQIVDCEGPMSLCSEL